LNKEHEALTKDIESSHSLRE